MYVTRFAAAKAAQYRGGFVRDGEEVVCNASDAPFAYRGATLPAKTHRLFTR